jgi:hypothetical protein
VTALASGCGSSQSRTAGVDAPTTTAPPSSTTIPVPVTSAATVAAPRPTTAAATTATPATTAVAAGGTCITGSWTSTRYAQQAQGATTTGGAGIRFVIGAHDISIDFTGMQPVSFSGDGVVGRGIYTGQEQGTFLPRPTTASTGTFTLAPGTSNVTFQTALPGGTGYGTPIKANGFSADEASGTWVCSGSDTASITIPTPDGPTTVAMTRQT